MILAFALLAAAGSAPTIDGEWRVTHAVVAPWVEETDARPDVTSLLGKTITFGDKRADGPGVLSCGNARYEYDERPLEGLFQGTLTAPVENGAASVGLVKAPVRSATMTCDTGIFDMHFATPDALLLGFDNAVWFLDRSPGTVAAEGSPEFVVQTLLEDHYAKGLGFYEERAKAQKPWFSTALSKKVDAYFAQDFPDDEVPPINGDVLTDSQEYPPVFSVRDAKVARDAATVPVRYDDGHQTRTVDFQLVRENGAWRIDDIAYAHGTPFSAMLAMKPGE